MKLLILQISDIHIKGKNDRVFTRRKQISEALRNVTDKVDLCVVAVTGDIAFSGTLQQYEEALVLLESLKTEIPTALDNTRVEFIAIPGNHDCDFSLSSKVRSSVMQVVKQDGLVDDSVINSVTSISAGLLYPA